MLPTTSPTCHGAMVKMRTLPYLGPPLTCNVAHPAIARSQLLLDFQISWNVTVNLKFSAGRARDLQYSSRCALSSSLTFPVSILLGCFINLSGNLQYRTSVRSPRSPPKSYRSSVFSVVFPDCEEQPRSFSVNYPCQHLPGSSQRRYPTASSHKNRVLNSALSIWQSEGRQPFPAHQCHRSRRGRWSGGPRGSRSSALLLSQGGGRYPSCSSSLVDEQVSNRR